MRNVSSMVFEEPGWILVLIQYLILTKMITRTAEPIVLAFKTTNIPTLADGQEVVSKKVPEQGTNQKKTEVLNDLT